MLTKQDYWKQHSGYDYWDIDTTRKRFERIATELYCKNILKDNYLIISEPNLQRMGVDVLTPDKTIDIKCRISVHPRVGAPRQFRDLTKYWHHGQDVLFEVEQRNSKGLPAPGWTTKSAPHTYNKKLPTEHKIVFVFLYIGYEQHEIDNYYQVVELDFDDVKKVALNYITNDYFRKTAEKAGYIRQLGNSSSKMPGKNISCKIKLLERLIDVEVVKGIAESGAIAC